MDAHAVPKNVLTVEFKLFGSLTIKQFVKILVGCMIAFGIYLLNINALIAYPTIIIIVVFSLASALLPDFAARAEGFMKALFVSPQYVWKKNGKTPEILRDSAVAPISSLEVEKAKLQSPVDYHNISIDKLLAARSFASQNDTASDQEDLMAKPNGGANFDRVYGQLFSDDVSAQPTTSVVKTGPNMEFEVRNMRNNAPRRLAAAPVASTASGTQLSSAELHQKLNELQQQLQDLNRVNATPAEKQSVLAQINQIYQIARVSNRPATAMPLRASNRMTIYGVVVDKREQPVVNAGVSVQDEQGKPLSSVVMTGADGKFALEAMPTNGSYLVSIKHISLKFPAYKIKSEGVTLPAFKFRER